MRRRTCHSGAFATWSTTLLAVGSATRCISMARPRKMPHADYCTPDAFADSQAALRERLADRDRWTETVVHPAGPLSVLDSLHRRCIELVVHSWDIAKSVDLTGVEVCPMSKELATYLSGVYAATNAGLAGSSYFASEPDGPAEDPRAKLLRLSGRVA